MKSPFKYIFFVYQWFILLPVSAVATILTAVITIIFSYTTKNITVKSIPAKWWSKFMCYASFISVSVEGMENIKQNQSYVIVANHQSMFDIWLIYGWLDRPFSWVMKKELRKIPFVGLACEKVGHIFVDRSNAIEAKRSILAAEKKLQNGNCVAVFPEGTRTKDGKVGSFKRGAFNMASDLHLPIVPISIIGAYERMSRYDWQVTPGKLKMKIHEPIPCDTNLTEQEIRALANRVREIIIEGMA
ncbi:MAG: lysophospholipid acyltransferase family protein [Paludibacteraceae bacterium]|nr:lysophospholipid acyltransferase family protein [Paludibacteraceae bacterium]